MTQIKRIGILFSSCLFIAAVLSAATRKPQIDTPSISCAGGTQVSRTSRCARRLQPRDCRPVSRFSG